MTVWISTIPKDPYRVYDVLESTHMASGCLQCPSPAPYIISCARHADIPRMMRPVGQATCEGLQLFRRCWEERRVEAARICVALTEANN